MQARGKTEEDVAKLLDAGVYDMEKLLEGGWVTGLKYADEVQVCNCNSLHPSGHYPPREFNCSLHY